MACRPLRGGETRRAEIASRCCAADASPSRFSEITQPVKRKTSNKKREAGPLKRVGLARALSKLGYCSRSRAAELIAAGQVKCNGEVRRDPQTPVDRKSTRLN